MTSQDHNKTLGILHLVYGGFHLLLLTLVTLFILLTVMGAVAGGPLNSGGFPFVAGVLIFALTFGAFFALPPVAAGYALLKRKSWARQATIVAAFFSVLNFPFGTALAAYSFWFLFGEGRNFQHTPANSWNARPPHALRDDASTVSTFGWEGQAKTYAEREREYVPPSQPPDWRS